MRDWLLYLCAPVKENIFSLNTPAQPVLPQWEFLLPSIPLKERFSAFTCLSKHFFVSGQVTSILLQIQSKHHLSVLFVEIRWGAKKRLHVSQREAFIDRGLNVVAGTMVYWPKGILKFKCKAWEKSKAAHFLSDYDKSMKSFVPKCNKFVF